jgi:hypothetical protein
MKRDMDLVRKILFALEARNHLPVAANMLKIEGHDEDAVDYHLEILSDSPYVTTVYSRDGWPNHRRLSWEGHEFLETIRDDTRWNKLKEASADAGAASIEAIAKAALSTAIKLTFSYLGLPAP